MTGWVSCEQCKRRLRVKDVGANNTLKCTYCGHLQFAPTPGAAPASPAWSPSPLAPPAAFGEVVGAAPAPSPGWGTRSRTNQLLDPDYSAALSYPAPTPWAVAAPAAPPAPDPPPRGLVHYLYWLVALTLIPLGMTVFHERDDVRSRYEDTRADNPRRVHEWELSEERNEDDLISSFPGERIHGAFLPRRTWWHWAFAGLSALSFLTLCVAIFPTRRSRPTELFAIGLFTGTVGVILLIVVQIAAFITPGVWILGGPFAFVMFILKFIAFSYISAMHPDTNFVASFIGFTCGVGLCEELVKALPIIWYYRSCDGVSWRGAVRWGLATGAGFGVAEAISYSSSFYNGLFGGEIYLVRFISCVGLHAVWSASVALMLYRHHEWLQDELRYYEYVLPLLRIIAVPMVLHGLYDTFLKMQLQEMALATAVASFGWLAWQIESLREQELRAHDLLPKEPDATPA